ncbi:MAG: recombinase family protein [Thermoleophilia bacterium]
MPVLSEQRVVRRILELAEAGTSATRIARLLNEAGIPTRRQRRWWGTTVIGILQRVAPELVETEKDRPVPSDPRERHRVAERRRYRTKQGLPP